jgi:biopolymer transport protein ExbD
MSIGSQQLGPADFTKHLKARAHKKSSRKKMLIAGLTLTSMVDMFSLLVIFLLQSFSTSPELLVVSKDVTLPSASTAKEIKDAPVLSLSASGVYLDQKKIGETADLLSNPEPLMKRLGELREVWQKTHPNQQFRGEINLQAHRELPSTLVSHFMQMLPSQNYSSVELAVVSGGGGT